VALSPQSRLSLSIQTQSKLGGRDQPHRLRCISFAEYHLSCDCLQQAGCNPKPPSCHFPRGHRAGFTGKLLACELVDGKILIERAESHSRGRGNPVVLSPWYPDRIGHSDQIKPIHRIRSPKWAGCEKIIDSDSYESFPSANASTCRGVGWHPGQVKTQKRESRSRGRHPRNGGVLRTSREKDKPVDPID